MYVIDVFFFSAINKTSKFPFYLLFFQTDFANFLLSSPRKYIWLLAIRELIQRQASMRHINAMIYIVWWPYFLSLLVVLGSEHWLRFIERETKKESSGRPGPNFKALLTAEFFANDHDSPLTCKHRISVLASKCRMPRNVRTRRIKILPLTREIRLP